MSDLLTVAIIHYHLRGGGVTRVIENAVKSLESHGVRAVVIVGEAPPEDSSLRKITQVVEGLSYGNNQLATKDARTLNQQIKEVAKGALGHAPDVWHIHNHSLAKNVRATRAFLMLAEQEKRVLFQIHDFAEDGRPKNYKRYREAPNTTENHQLTERLYPSAPQIHYALLNGRDYKILDNSGIPSKQLHLLSNPVSLGDIHNHSPDDISDIFDKDHKLYLYPTRAIRRKNIGEFLLWSAIADHKSRFAITLAPQNPKARPVYNQWVNFSHQLKLPVLFEAGIRWPGSFISLLKRADYIVTTSVAEGFGLAYLEPWLIDQPVYGRNLPEITGDFTEKGVQLPNLYDRLKLPVSWLDWITLKEKLESKLRETYASYGHDIEDQQVQKTVQYLTRDELIDFGVLDEDMQQTVIKKLDESPTLKDQLNRHCLGPQEITESLINSNKMAIKNEFSLAKYGSRLMKVYQKLYNSDVQSVEYADSSKVLNEFLAPENFTLLRT